MINRIIYKNMIIPYLVSLPRISNHFSIVIMSMNITMSLCKYFLRKIQVIWGGYANLKCRDSNEHKRL